MECAISSDPPFIEWMSEGARVRGAVGLAPPPRMPLVTIIKYDNQLEDNPNNPATD